jgi:hypothetical protein
MVGMSGVPAAEDDAVASTYEVERQQHIAAPASVVLERVVDLRRWASWSPWEGLDPDQARTYGGPAAGVGAWYEWEGNRKAGHGRMEILEADDRQVTIDLRFLRPFRSQSTTAFAFEPEGDGTRVTWTMTGRNTPIMRLMGVFLSMDKMIGPDFERGLVSLKAESEAAVDGPVADD